MSAVLLLLVCLALAACTGFAPSAFAPTPAVERPLVVLLARIVGPTAAEKDQWLESAQTISKPIPDNLTVGVQDPRLTVDTNIASACTQLFGVAVNVSIAHPRPADLVITLTALSRPGDGILATAVLWDGPSKARSDPSKADSLILPADFDASSLLLRSSDCSRWRLDVDDRASGQTGTLHTWTLKRRVALYPFAHSRPYYEGLLFGTGGHAFNVRDYFLELSRHRFTFANAGVFEATLARALWFGVSTDEERARSITLALEDAGFDFAAYDRNRNGRIDDEELAIVVIKNDVAAGGANRGHADPSGCTRLHRSPLDVCARVVFAGEEPDFDTLTHELSHSLAPPLAYDVYGPWDKGYCFSNGLTLMSCSSFVADGRRTLYLDPWHRAKFGWMTPYDAVYPYEMGDETWVDARGTRARPAIIRNPRDLNEYYLFEYRGGRGYDGGVSDFGIVAWHVTESAGALLQGDYGPANGLNAVGPDSEFGATRAWTSADGRFMLPWRDGSLLPFSFFVVDPKSSPSSAILDFVPAPAGHRPPQVRIIQPGDNSTVDAGWVNLEAVTDASVADQDIRWFSSSDGLLGTGRRLTSLIAVPGQRTLTAVARDRHGARGVASIAFTARKVPPTATIYSPAPNAVLLRNQPVTLWGKGATPGVLNLACSRLTWTTNRLLPRWSLTGRTNQLQCVDNVSFDMLGPVTINLTVTDPYGSEATTSVNVTFVEPPADGPPIVTITSPAASTRLMADQRHRLSGVVSDPAGGTVSYRWAAFDVRNSVEIDLGAAPSFEWRPELTMRGGPVEIRLYGTNARGMTTVARLSVFVEPPPR